MKHAKLSAGGRSVSVNHDVCSGTGMCRDALPGLFEIDRQAWLNPEFDLANASIERLEDAAAMCPWFAITVETAEG